MSPARTEAPQDDSREQDMLRVFGLRQPIGSSRGDNDAFLELSNKEKQCFELKSTVRENFVTARDFGVNHINEWRDKHILASFYKKGTNMEISWSLLVPNVYLQLWLDEQLNYIKPDLEIIEIVSEEYDENFYNRISTNLFGTKEYFSLNELKSILKSQIDSKEYDYFLDLNINGEKYCSRNKMFDALKKRTKYLLERGSTRNNPHFNKTWINKIISMDKNLSLTHKWGDFSRPKEWLLELMDKYSI